MSLKKNWLLLTSMVIGLAIFLPSQAETCYCSSTDVAPKSAGPVTPHSYVGGLTGPAPHSHGPVVASERDPFGDDYMGTTIYTECACYTDCACQAPQNPCDTPW